MALHEIGLRATLKERRETAQGLAEIERGVADVGDSSEKAGKQASIASRGFHAMVGGMRSAAGFAGRGFVSAVRTVGRVSVTAFKGAVVGAAALSAALIGVSVHAIGLAGDARETASAFDTVFGRSAGRLGNDIDNLSKRFGLYAPELQDAARQLGVFGKAAGVAQKDLPKFSKDLVQAGLDLSSFYNVSSAEAFQAIQSGLSGEAEPLRRFGIFISDSAMKAQAAQMGLTDELTEQQKVMVRHRLIMKGLGDAQGDLERTSRGFANQQRAAGGRVQSILQMLGGPLTTAATGAFRGLNAILKVGIRQLNREMPDLEKRAKKVSQALQRWGYEAARNLPDTLKRIGRWAGWVGDQTRKLPAVIDAVRRGGSQLVDTFSGLNADGGLTELKGNLVEMKPAAAALGRELPGISDALTVTNIVTGFLADHAETLVKYMPLLVVAFVAYKGAQMAANIVAAATVPIKIADVIATRQLTKANKQLVLAQRGTTASTVANTTATATNTAAQSTGLVARARHTVGLVAHRVATTAATAATKAATVATRLLSIAFLTSPIGLVVLGVIGLVAAFVLAYKKSETFRSIVTGALNAVKTAAVFVWDWIRAHWPLLLGILTGPFGLAVLAIIKNWDRIKTGASTVKDWVVDRFDSLVGFFTRMPGRMTRAASGLFNGVKDAFRSAVNFIIDGWNGLSFSIPGVDTGIPGVGTIGGFTLSTPNIPRLAAGGIVSARPGGIIANIGEGRWDEAVVPLDGRDFLVDRHGVTPLPNLRMPMAPDLPPMDLDDIEPGDHIRRQPVHVHLEVDGHELAEVVLDDFDDRAARR